MRLVELLLLVYFCTFCVAALAMGGRCRHWLRTFGWAAAGMGIVVAASVALPASSDAVSVAWVRDWWPLVALPLAYWVPAPLAGNPNLSLERWLQNVDDRLGLSRLNRGHPALEIAYLFVYPMVPAGLLAVLAIAPDDAPRFWTAVLLSVLPCYGLLPLLPTRPPRAFLRPDPSSHERSSGARQANVAFLAAFGNQWNTLPSGHAAGAAAIAGFLWRISSPLSSLFILLAVGIALGTVRGRYHYAVDTIAGVTLGAIAASIV